MKKSDLPFAALLDAAIVRGRNALARRQQPEGSWCFELESDATITAEYILMMHFMAKIDTARQEKMARYLRAIQRLETHGAWDLYVDGAPDVSASVKAYFALKAAGDKENAPHMVRAREAILKLGGAAKSNVFTRILLATFGQVPWRATPFMPVEFVLFPKWVPISMYKVAYWARTTMVPLLVLCSLKARAKNPHNVSIAELFVTPPEQEREYFARGKGVRRAFLVMDRLLRHVDPLIPGALRKRAIKHAEAWCAERMNGEDGMGGIFPPIVYSYQMMEVLGYPEDHPLRRDCENALEKLLVERPDGSVYCQPCLSPVWDTAWSTMALEQSLTVPDTPAEEATEANIPRAELEQQIALAYDWLAARQVDDLKGDWIENVKPDVPPGGWAFQYENPYYPDIDDSAVVVAMLHRRGRLQKQVTGADPYAARVTLALDWMRGLQSRNGGFAAFDADCDRLYLNAIPFADHGALLDPPTEDVSGRVLLCFGVTGREEDKASLARCIDYIKATQCPDGSWWGRWGTNYIYGTWSVLAGLALAGEDPKQPYIARALAWLRSRQHADGGWGETNDSYIDPALAGTNGGESVSNFTAWALLAQMAFGDFESESVQRGIAYLLSVQDGEGFWWHRSHNAPGFPRIYYLKYHGYTAYFPLWALSRYRRLVSAAQAKTHADTRESAKEKALAV
ncbi:squalene-hopene/tetraprenyl-beta-curcumene cyclase [Paraburkholderia bannensis]|uniref:Squalene-hopene/tetraprenyl-beta-curcumene cyclase n=2 Tax=Burkholderiaceae TaxID=119060 RepID=A0A7W9U2E0_9BURK|nr:squalene-hopene/tetraprenyl-beta-curcumene cyclase [Paraburkholderia sp. WP4_3_2]MBB6105784.1 squalene-hopene/tetraprenyl-beta-curcumene cyclase [Paraburkholderia bannensis]